jgi:hypothetical protein
MMKALLQFVEGNESMGEIIINGDLKYHESPHTTVQ